MTQSNRISLLRDRITFGDGLSVTFQRTLRIPDDGKDYPLPPGLGCFPIRRVDDYLDRVPAEWREHGGVFLPMYQREAMWLSFEGEHWKPRAVKVAIGKVCAITGKRWSDELRRDPQDYIVTPPQPWLDGIATGKGTIRQFVAMPLGLGYTVEGQVTGEETTGGIQLAVFEPKPGRFRPAPPRRGRAVMLGGGPTMECAAAPAAPCASAPAGGMGLAAGGTMKQKIYPDPYGFDTWDRENRHRVFVHLVNSAMWREITGEEPPRTPVTAKEYARHGFPWFDLYDEDAATVSPTETLEKIESIAQIDGKKSSLPLQDDSSVEVGPVKKLWLKVTGQVRDGSW